MTHTSKRGGAPDHEYLALSARNHLRYDCADKTREWIDQGCKGLPPLVIRYLRRGCAGRRMSKVSNKDVERARGRDQVFSRAG